jgi:prepilin-type processing-associated H-X9-DG protein/prepilin-type N-terminal cleavage/methylation domain-containing protein
MNRKHSAFTLVEILIVVAVVLVIAALLFPVFNRVREKGKQAACQSNLRQLYIGLQQYVQDNDSRQPPWDWRRGIESYVKSPGVFTCPSFPQPIYTPERGTETGEYNFWIGFLNTLVTQPVANTSGQTLAGVNESVLVDASKILVSGDVAVAGFFRKVPMPQKDACGLTMADGVPDVLQTVPTVHSGGGNYLFYDGHVKWMTPEAFTQALCEAAPFLQPPFRADGEHHKPK